MVEVTIEENNLKLHLHGIGKVLSLQSELVIPLTHVRGITADSGALDMPKGLRGPGTHIPGVLYAGTFRKDGDKVFWNVHNAMNAVVIELDDEEFKRLVVEVKNPAESVALVEKHIL